MAFVIIVMGLGSILWQFVCLRELQTTFLGNELSLSIILSCWLAGSAIGGFLSKYFLGRQQALPSPSGNQRGLSRILLSILFLNALLCLFSLFLSRGLKLFLRISPFELLLPLQILFIACLATIPQTIGMGLSFIIACAIIRNPMKAYYQEALGAFLAGLLSLVVVKYCTSTEILWFTSCLFLLACLSIKPKSAPLRAIVILTLLCALLLPPSGLLGKFEDYTNGLRYRPQALTASLNSIYATIAITRTGQHYNLYENGKLSFSTEDTEAREEFAHLILLHHPQPKKVLLIGGGTSGLLAEILKHPVEKVDYVEPDTKLMQAAAACIPQAYAYGLADTRVHLYHLDARFFIKTTKNKYDCIVVNVGDPSNLQQNRFFTLEFFHEIKKILLPDGIFSLAVSSKEDILSGEMLKYDASLYKTAKAAFAALTLIPGERLILICSPQPLAKNAPQELIKRFKGRKIATKYFTQEYISARLWRQEYIQKLLNDTVGSVDINRDYFPSGFFYYLSMYGKQSWLNFNRLWQISSRLNIASWLILILTFTFFFRKNILGFSILTSGASGIALSIIISLIFQINFGFLYYRLGAIIASFMLGLGLGSICSPRLFGFKKGISRDRLLSLLEFSLGITALFLCVILRQNQMLYFLITLFIGFLIGLESGIFYTKLPAATVYALDLSGACAGSLLAGLALIPVLGIFTTCALIAFTKCLSAVLFLRKPGR